MDKLRNAIRKILTTELNNSEIAKTCAVSRATVRRYRLIAAGKKYEWNALADLSDDDLNGRFNSVGHRSVRKRMPKFEQIHKELQQKGATLTGLWEEYRGESPDDALSYSQFTEHYRRHVQSLDLSMRQTHPTGEKVFVDFSGKRLKYTNRETGEEVHVEVFVGVLGYSKLTFVTCVASQKIGDWIEAHNRMFAFFDGVPLMIVPDNLKSAVIKAGAEPTLNRNYAELGDHYGTTIVPARVYRPRDKAYAEHGVQLVQRWILFKLRNWQFFSLAEINAAIAPLLAAFNERAFKKLPGSRRSRFEESERSKLLPLPHALYTYAEWTCHLQVDKSYHVPVQDIWYSVPHRLVGKIVVACSSGNTVEIFHQRVRVASHARSTVAGDPITDPSHPPESHRAYAERTPEKYTAWAKTIGPNLLEIVKHQFDRKVPVLGLPACDLLSRLVLRHGAADVESAARRAVEIKSPTVKSVKSLLYSGKHRKARAERSASVVPTNHTNVRGSAYYR